MCGEPARVPLGLRPGFLPRRRLRPDPPLPPRTLSFDVANNGSCSGSVGRARPSRERVPFATFEIYLVTNVRPTRLRRYFGELTFRHRPDRSLTVQTGDIADSWISRDAMRESCPMQQRQSCRFNPRTLAGSMGQSRGSSFPGGVGPCRPRGLWTPPGYGQPRARDRRPRASGRWLPAALGQPRFGGPDSPVRGCPPRTQALRPGGVFWGFWREGASVALATSIATSRSMGCWDCHSAPIPDRKKFRR